MNAKLYLKKKLPFLIKIKNNIRLKKSFKYDYERYHNYLSNINDNDPEGLKGNLIYYSHQIEKGLSHKNFREGFGKNACINIKKYLDKYIENGNSIDSFEYQLTISILNAYYKKHIEKNLPQFFYDLFSEYLEEIKNSSSEIGGISQTTLEDKKKNRIINYKDLFHNRVSIREYGENKVDNFLIFEAISMSMKTPSVCNRQSFRVTVITEQNTIKKTLKIQGGFAGYPTPPVLLLVTTDIRDFIGANERNQTYVDGGLFGMSLLNSLEFVGLAACPLNAMFYKKEEIKIRSLLNIPNFENLIFFISVGNFEKEMSFCKSARMDYSSITKLIE